MTKDYLAQAREGIERDHAYLLNLITAKEIDILKSEIPEGETPLWRHWEEYVVKTLVLGKSPVTVRAVRDGLHHNLLCLPLSR